MSAPIVIVGGGQAGSQAIDALRRGGYEGSLVLVGEEAQLPYQRPPLSKKYLSGELQQERLLFRQKSFYDDHKVEMKLGIKATHLDLDARRLMLANGETIAFDQALLSLGAISRQLTCPGADLPGVRYLRTIADVPPIRANLKPGARVVIIGGGYIGLETAATARALGCGVTVLEMADRVMNRVVASNVSQYFEHEHRLQGVKIVCNARVIRLEGHERVERVVCADGSSYEADLLIVGIGSVANADLAIEAGLQCENGILVDQNCRTSHEAVFAAGDCTNHLSLRFEMRVRLESVDSAYEQANTAAANMLGRAVVHDSVPWFWSDQFDNKLLIVGLSAGHDQQVTRGDAASRSFSVCYLKGGELMAVEAVNRAKDYMAARKMIASRARPDLDKLMDPAIALKDSL